MSRRIFMGLSGGMGPVLRTMPIAEEHVRAGDTIAFSIYDEHAAAYIERQGFVHLADDDPFMPDPSLTIPRGPIFYHLDHYYAQLGLADIAFVRSWVRHRIDMLKSFRPSLVYSDMSPHTTIAARYLGIPVVSIVQSCFHPAGKSIHYWGNPPRNTPRVTVTVNRVLDELGLPPIDRMERLNEGDVTVVPSIPELDPIIGEAIHYVGPIEPDTGGSTRAVLTGNPDIIVYAGRLSDTSGDSGLRLVRLVLEAFHCCEEQVILVCAGDLPAREEALLVSSSTIVRVERYNPETLSNAKLFIHHGGHGSCLTSITHAIPALIVPTHTEREFNARRLWALGGGEYVMPDTITSRHFYELARHVIADDYRMRLLQLREKLGNRRYGGARVAYFLGRSLINQSVGG